MFAVFTVVQEKLLDCIKKDLGEGDHKADLIKSLDQLETNSDRIDLALEKLTKYNLLEGRFHPDEKKDDKAELFKTEATKCYCPGKYNAALQLCTMQIVHAKTNEIRAMGYANRSAALLKLELYEDCILDIERAIIHNYPDQAIPRIIARKQQAAELLRKAPPRPKPFEETPKIPENQRNHAFPNLSNSVSVQKDQKGRRYLSATKDIQIGEVILVEEPFVVTIGDKPLYHCHECLNVCYSLIPCLDCTHALYCSEICKLNAYYKYHQYECPILLSLLKLFGRESHFMFPLKMIFYHNIAKMQEILELAKEFEIEDTRNAKLELTLLGAIIYDLVKNHTTMFEGVDGAEVETYFKNTLVPYMYYCMGHSASITEYVDYGRLTVHGEPVVMNETFAYALYKFNHLAGHSCCPNVYRHYHGLSQVYRAFRTIKKGEKCLSTYGPSYNVTDKESRNLHLIASYNFQCNCRACQEEWPQLGYTDKTTAEIKEMGDILSSDSKTVKRYIPKKIDRIKHIEKFEPREDVTHQTKMLELCFDIIGNKRRIP